MAKKKFMADFKPTAPKFDCNVLAGYKRMANAQPGNNPPPNKRP